MADKQKKGLAALILAGKPEAEAPADEAMEDVSPLRSAAEEIMDAVEMKDAAALEEALKAFIHLCDSEELPAEEPEME